MADHALVRPWPARVVRRRIWVEPITELKDVSTEPVGEQSPRPADVRGHRCRTALEDRAVAVGAPQRPDDPDRGVAPDRGAVGVGGTPRMRLELEDVRDDERHHAVGMLLLSARLMSQSDRKGPTSNRNAARGCEGRDVPVQPSRLVALRQSVDVEEVPRVPDTTLPVELVQRVASEHSKVPVRRRSE